MQFLRFEIPPWFGEEHEGRFCKNFGRLSILQVYKSYNILKQVNLRSSLLLTYKSNVVKMMQHRKTIRSLCHSSYCDYGKWHWVELWWIMSALRTNPLLSHTWMHACVCFQHAPDCTRVYFLHWLMGPCSNTINCWSYTVLKTWDKIAKANWIAD